MDLTAETLHGGVVFYSFRTGSGRPRPAKSKPPTLSREARLRAAHYERLARKKAAAEASRKSLLRKEKERHRRLAAAVRKARTKADGWVAAPKGAIARYPVPMTGGVKPPRGALEVERLDISWPEGYAAFTANGRWPMIPADMAAASEALRKQAATLYLGGIEGHMLRGGVVDVEVFVRNELETWGLEWDDRFMEAIRRAEGGERDKPYRCYARPRAYVGAKPSAAAILAAQKRHNLL